MKWEKEFFFQKTELFMLKKNDIMMSKKKITCNYLITKNVKLIKLPWHDSKWWSHVVPLTVTNENYQLISCDKYKYLHWLC